MFILLAVSGKDREELAHALRLIAVDIENNRVDDNAKGFFNPSTMQYEYDIISEFDAEKEDLNFTDIFEKYYNMVSKNTKDDDYEETFNDKKG